MPHSIVAALTIELKILLEHFPVELNRVDFGGFPSGCQSANLGHWFA
jgi:hypothetical protein